MEKLAIHRAKKICFDVKGKKFRFSILYRRQKNVKESMTNAIVVLSKSKIKVRTN
jgi:hypothetical protein